LYLKKITKMTTANITAFYNTTDPKSMGAAITFVS